MIRLFKVFMADEAKHLAGNVLDSGYVGQGDVNTEFEQDLSSFFGSNVLTLNSCTSALDLSLHLAGVNPGNEVISTPVTCTATNGVIVNRGATIVWADVDPKTGLIDPEDVGRKLTTKTAAIMAVDWAGNSCDYDALRDVTDGVVPIIEDAAHHIMADIETGGDYICWSFQAIKHLTTVDGGAISVPPEEYSRARLLRWYGLDRDSSASFRCAQDIVEAGYKYHMNDLNSAIGLANLPHVPELVAKHRDNARYYDERFAGSGLGLPPINGRGSYWLYTVLVDNPQEFELFLASQGVEANPVHKRNDVHTAFRRNAYPTLHTLTGVGAFADHEVAIPVGWWLTEEDREQVANAVLSYAQIAVTA